jgi:ribose 5-phosphate isomerase B
MKIYLAADHTGFELKKALAQYVQQLGHEAIDCGSFEYDADDNFPVFILKAAEGVSQNPDTRGIIIGGSGQGEAMAANRLPGVRAAVYYGSAKAITAVDISGRQSENPFEIIRLSRLHNDSNILSLGVRFVSEEEAKGVVKLWLDTEFSGQDRYARRIDQVEAYSQTPSQTHSQTLNGVHNG